LLYATIRGLYCGCLLQLVCRAPRDQALSGAGRGLPLGLLALAAPRATRDIGEGEAGVVQLRGN